MNSTAENWLVLRSGSGAPDWNMALDEALLEASARLGQPVLRFYQWLGAPATFGYFQNYANVQHMTPLRPLIRRPTGGGVVPHKEDWTYSLMFPPQHAWFELKAAESYKRAHTWIRDAFAQLNLDTELSPCCQNEGKGLCFVGAEQFDLLWNGHKIAGAAQRRNKHGLLIQGSVQPLPPGITPADWEAAMCSVASNQWSAEWAALQPDAELTHRAAILATEKYSRHDYNQRR